MFSPDLPEQELVLIVNLGNHSPHRAIDSSPCVTSIHIPDADENGLGGYTHKPDKNFSLKDFREHRQEAFDFRGGITQLPDYEALLSIIAAWPEHSHDKPQWVQIDPQLTDPKTAAHLQDVLKEFYGITKTMPGNLEDMYWTRFGAPGQGGPSIPNPQALFLNAGRVQQGNNYGGGQVGATGQASASSASTLTTTTTAASLNCYAGYRVYATVSATVMVWGNVLSNTNGANTVLTVDRWYNSATPGGAVASTPSATATYMIADGGTVSFWFVALTTTNITPAATDTTLSGEYTTASGGYIRKISPYSLTSGTSPMTFTLTPVYTGNGSDTYPSTFFAIGVFCSMVTGSTPCMKFETSLNASATVAASGDQLTVTETVSGS